jgi:hypothetical protein
VPPWSTPALPLEQAFDQLLFDGSVYPAVHQTMTGGRVTVGYDFLGLVRGAYKANPIVFACIDRRQALFSEARFQYRQFKKGRPGDLFGGPGLTILEHPWPGGTTGDLLAFAEVHNSCSGNFFCARRGDRLAPLRPDWVSVIIGSNTEADDPADVWDIDAEVLGYLYTEGGPGSGRDPVYLMPEEVAHYMPRPDPEAPWRGMSWVTALLREVAADREMTDHKSKYLDAGATPNLAIKLDVTDAAKFQEWVDKFREAGGRPRQPVQDAVPVERRDADPARLRHAESTSAASRAQARYGSPSPPVCRPPSSPSAKACKAPR